MPVRFKSFKSLAVRVEEYITFGVMIGVDYFRHDFMFNFGGISTELGIQGLPSS